MKRVIVDYKKITKEIFDLLAKKYPNGYNAMDIISFRDKKQNLVDAVEVKNSETIYLVKVSKKLTNTLEEYEVSDDTYDDYDDQDLLFVTELPEENVDFD